LLSVTPSSGVFRYGGMPLEEGERTMRFVARDMMPELKKLPAEAQRLDLVAAEDAPKGEHEMAVPWV
jgi:hypothetical protein